MNYLVQCLACFTVAATVLAAVTIVDTHIFTEPFLSERKPRFDTYFVLRTVIACLVALLAVAGIYCNRDKASALESRRPASSAEFLAAAVFIGLPLISALLLLCNPPLFHWLAVEDSVVEWTSALLLFSGSIVLLLAATGLAMQPHGRRRGHVPASIFSLLLLVIAMEEISWFQRLFAIPTPDLLADLNMQGEMNLHNLSTSEVKNAYYLGAFSFLVLMPFIALRPRAGACWHAMATSYRAVSSSWRDR
ncbi:MAG: hypothetical protein ACREDO_06440 [Methyloceanibacter sp.]